ncbi:hypothetical protein [Streptococcus loxodontisalivarius]|uniref:Membrane protein n=1 Tax=Streptococcus loxodontisalivarius TaxID=1349415 RepID=A0ABS2PRS1_9STRE|nr:hypothetical protein [Streptococcus loxodontisalivarius]MBM7642626.1 putative membrane protein [Streptococcus loxodontisalivarius]
MRKVFSANEKVYYVLAIILFVVSLLILLVGTYNYFYKNGGVPLEWLLWFLMGLSSWVDSGKSLADKWRQVAHVLSIVLPLIWLVYSFHILPLNTDMTWYLLIIYICLFGDSFKKKED